MEAADGAAPAPSDAQAHATEHDAGVQADAAAPPTAAGALPADARASSAPAPASPAPAPVPEPVSVPEPVPLPAAASVEGEGGGEGGGVEAAAFVSGTFLHPSPMAVPSSAGATNSSVAGLPPLFPHARKADADALNMSTGTTSMTTGVTTSATSTSFSSSSIFVEGKRSVEAASAAAFASAAEVQSLSHGMSTVANTFTNMRHQASNMAAMLRTTTKERDQLAEQVRELQARLAGDAGAAAAMEELEMRCVQLQAELEGVRYTCQHQHTSTDLASRLAEEKRTIDALRESLNASNAAKNAAAADLATARTELSAAATDKARLKLELDQARSELAAAHAASSAAAVTVADLDTRLRHALNERDLALSDKETLTARLRSAEAATSGMEASGHTYQQRVIDAEAAASRAREELADFNKRWVEDTEGLIQQLNDRDARVAQLEAALTAARMEAKSLDDACSVARNAATAASNEVAAVQASKAAMEEEVRRLRAAESAALAQVRELQTNVARLSATASLQVNQASESSAQLLVKLREQVRSADAEREALRDILSGVVPLPSLVTERVEEAHRMTFTSAHASLSSTSFISTRSPMRVPTSARRESPSPAADASMRAGGERSPAQSAVGGASRVGLLDTSLSGAASSLVAMLRALVSERPTIIEAVTAMDMQLRHMSVEMEHLNSSLLSAKAAEAEYNNDVGSYRRQIAALRSEQTVLQESCAAQLTRIRDLESAMASARLDVERAQAAEQQAVAARDAARNELQAAEVSLGEVRASVEVLEHRLESQRVEWQMKVTMASTLAEAAHREASAAAANLNSTSAMELTAAEARIVTLEADVQRLQQDAASSEFRYTAALAEVERVRLEASTLQQRIMTLEVAISNSEANAGDALMRAEESNKAAAAARAAVEEMAAERDTLSARAAALNSELVSLRTKLAEAHAREARLREDANAAASLRTTVATLESSVSSLRTSAVMWETRYKALQESARRDADTAAATLAQMAHEVQRVMSSREEDASHIWNASSAANREAAAVAAERDAAQQEAANLRERCKALQAQLASTASDVQSQRNLVREYSNAAMEARAELRAEVEHSTGIINALKSQLESIKTDFAAFLAMCAESPMGATHADASFAFPATPTMRLSTLGSETSFTRTPLATQPEAAGAAALGARERRPLFDAATAPPGAATSTWTSSSTASRVHTSTSTYASQYSSSATTGAGLNSSVSSLLAAASRTPGSPSRPTAPMGASFNAPSSPAR